MRVDVKIQCDCGACHKFDVEPLHGRMPQKVGCPQCGVDGPPAANAVLRAKLGLPETLPSARSGGEEIHREPPSPASDLDRGHERGRARLLPSPNIPKPQGSAGASPYQAHDRFGPGLAGAAAAAVVAMLAWFFLIKATGYPLGFAAWGVGLLVGLGARGLGREGSRRLGLAAGACAFVAILTGQLLAAQSHASHPEAGVSGGGIGWLTLVWLLMAVLSAFKLASTRQR